MSKNSIVIKQGMAKARALIYEQIRNAGIAMALISLKQAVDAWDAGSGDRNLTGNTRTGFCSAVYIDGKMVGDVYNVFDLSAQPMHPSAKFAYVGKKGFRDYDSGEYIGSKSDPSVRQYSNEEYRFLPSFSKYGFETTEQWIKTTYRPSLKEGLVVVVANCSSYVEFLHAERGMDILESESNYSNMQMKLISSFGMQEKL